MLRKKKLKSISNDNIVILNFALDTSKITGKITSDIYLMASKLGKLKNAKFYDLVTLSEQMDETIDTLILSAIATESHLKDQEKMIKEMVREEFVLANLNEEETNHYLDLSKKDKGKRSDFIQNRFFNFAMNKLTKIERDHYEQLDLDDKLDFLDEYCLAEYKNIFIDKYINDLHRKILSNLHLQAQEVLSKEEFKNYILFNEVKSAIANATVIIILGHCSQDSITLRSDSDVVISPERIISFFPDDISNKHIDIVACEGNKFGLFLTNSLKKKMNMDVGFDCDGVTLSSRKHITMPLPNGNKLYFKATKSGRTKMFSVDKDYRTDILIKKNDHYFQNISNQLDKNQFKAAVNAYRINKKKQLAKLKKKNRKMKIVPPMPALPPATLFSPKNIPLSHRAARKNDEVYKLIRRNTI